MQPWMNNSLLPLGTPITTSAATIQSQGFGPNGMRLVQARFQTNCSPGPILMEFDQEYNSVHRFNSMVSGSQWPLGMPLMPNIQPQADSPQLVAPMVFVILRLNPKRSSSMKN